jgi:hypothetical protein
MAAHAGGATAARTRRPGAGLPLAVHGFWRWLACSKTSRRAVDEVAAALRFALTRQSP